MKNKVREIMQAIPWLTVFVILLIGVLASGAIYFFRTSQQEMPNKLIGKEGVYHDVTFLQADGSVLEVKKVADCESVMPPVWEGTENALVFRGWSMNLSSITCNTEAKPMIHDLTDEKNVFYMDTSYEESGRDVWVELKLGGHVNLSGIKVTLAYDSEVLNYLESKTEHDYVQVTKAEDGRIEIIIDSKENLTESTVVLQMKFHIEDVDYILTHLNIGMKEPRMMAGGSVVGTDSTAVDGKIYIY